MLEPRANRQGNLVAVAVWFRRKLRDAPERDSLEEDFTVSRRDRSLKSSSRGWQSRLLLPRIVQVNLRRPRLAVVGRLFDQLPDVVLAEIKKCHARFGGFAVAPDHVSGVDEVLSFELSDHFCGCSGRVDPILRPLLGLRVESVEALPGVSGTSPVFEDYTAVENALDVARPGRVSFGVLDVPIAEPEIEGVMRGRIARRFGLGKGC